MKGSFVEPCRSPYLWIQVCREKYLQGTRGACLYGVWIKNTNVKKQKDDLAGNKENMGEWRGKHHPGREGRKWGKDLIILLSQPAAYWSFTSNHLSDGGLDRDTQLNQEGKEYTEIQISISQQKRWNSHAHNTHPTMLLVHTIWSWTVGHWTDDSRLFQTVSNAHKCKNTFAP